MKCAIYIRVSTDKEEQKTSLENQKDLFLNYVAEKKWDIFKIYQDIESGTKDNREAFQQMISDAKDKKFDIILAKELSRLARNSKLSHDIKYLAEQNNIHIITLDNAINTLENSSIGNILFGIYASLYEHESMQVSNRVKIAFKSRASRGLFKGSRPPYGYFVKDDKLHINDDDTPNIVKRIFNEYIEGRGFDAIAKGLYNDNIPTPSTYLDKSTTDKWQGSSIRCILTNPHYTGDLVQHRTTTRSITSNKRNIVDKANNIIVTNTHEPIISKAEFIAVQELIDSRKRKRPAAQNHLFTNLLFCADCGRKLHYKKNRKGYICGNYNRHGIKACNPHLIKELDLSNIIMNDFKVILTNLDDDFFTSNLENHTIKNYTIAKKKLSTIENKIKSITNNKCKVLEKFIQDEILKSDYDMYINNCELDIHKLQKEKIEYESIIRNSSSTDMLSNLDNFKSFLDETSTLSTKLLNILVSKIEIKNDGNPRIYYKFPSFFLNKSNRNSKE